MVYEHIKDLTYISGLCHEIASVYDKAVMSDEEYEMLCDHFKAQRVLHSEFQTKERNWHFDESDWYWWWTEDEDDNPVNRIAFIKKLMETAE